jgi:probable phosphoglycerate mutase
MRRDFQRPFELPVGATEVVLIRHGSARHRAPAGPADLVDGHSDPELTELGHRQAEAVSRRLGAARPAGLFVTPLRRTQQTAAPLARRIGCEPVVVPELNEVHLGDWEGQLDPRVARDDALTHKLFAVERWDVIPNAEPMRQFADRVRRGLDRLVDAGGPDQTVLAVVHGGVIAEACRQVTGSRAFAFLYADNGSITRLMRLASRRWALISFNDTAHLPGSDGR